MSKLTKKFVESIKPVPGKVIKSWDYELKGFGLITYPTGRKTYCIQYRNQDRVKKRFKIGTHGLITTEIARDKAKKLLGDITQGQDPCSDRKQQQNQPKMNDLIHDYLQGHALKKRSRSLSEDRRYIESFIRPAFGEKKVETLTCRDIEHLHTQLSSTPYQANRVLSLVSKLFSLAVSWGWRSDNPAQGVERYQEIKRDRWLQGEEFEKFWEILDRYPDNVTALLLKFLLLTGARKGEAMGATWDQFDMKQGVWTKPSHMTKQKKQERLPLSQEALGVLKILQGRKDLSPYVFPGRLTGQPLKEIKTFWKKVCTEAGLENLRIHDLRHTHASHLVSSGMSLSIVGRLLGHTQASTTQRYAHLADEPLRKAAELFGQKVGQKSR